MSMENGQAAMQEPTAPAAPWLAVDPGHLIGELQRQIAAQATEMAAMRLYVAQLHDALEAATRGTT